MQHHKVICDRPSLDPLKKDTILDAVGLVALLEHG